VVEHTFKIFSVFNFTPPSKYATMASNDGFSFPLLLKQFESVNTTLRERKEVHTETFLSAYKELAKLFDTLGKGMSFVKSDVMEKVLIIEALYMTNPTEFQTLHKIIQHELKMNLTATPDKRSGSRTILRLVRALDFIVNLLQNICDNTEELGESARKAYNITLVHHHNFWVRQAVGVGFYTLPYKDTFLKEMGKQVENPINGFRKLEGDIRPVLLEMQTVYTQHSLNQLP